MRLSSTGTRKDTSGYWCLLFRLVVTSFSSFAVQPFADEVASHTCCDGNEEGD